MSGVAAVLLDEVAEQPAQAGGLAVIGDVRELIQAAVGQGRGDARPGPYDRIVPEGVELLRRVAGGAAELPLVAAVMHAVPGCADRLAAQLGRERVVLDQCEVLEQPAEGERGGSDADSEPGHIEI